MPKVTEREAEQALTALPEEELAPGFADNFDRLLGLHRLSARDAGELLGISPTTLSYWRNGKRVPNTESLKRVCELFEVGMWEMLTASPEDVLFDRERFQRVEARLRDPKTKAIVGLMDALVKKSERTRKAKR